MRLGFVMAPHTASCDRTLSKRNVAECDRLFACFSVLLQSSNELCRELVG